jgi:7,8-dihydropterin-6-yl-methyl-4-(beta-D-ribofuranosyl)aminobenzene 5'-phosphate synthase
MIKMIVLNDDRCVNEKLECEHGLSLYIEYDNIKLLFDTGQTDIFLSNAIKLGIDLAYLDFIILCHGDYDHGNGLKYLNT